MLSEAKHLCAQRDRSFAALRMTGLDLSVDEELSRSFEPCRSQCCTTERTNGKLMIDHDNLEEFRDPQTYDLEDEGYDEDYPLTEQWARSLGGPLLDLACGTGRMALRMAAQGYQVTGVDIMPEMIARARQKAAK